MKFVYAIKLGKYDNGKTIFFEEKEDARNFLICLSGKDEIDEDTLIEDIESYPLWPSSFANKTCEDFVKSHTNKPNNVN